MDSDAAWLEVHLCTRAIGRMAVIKRECESAKRRPTWDESLAMWYLVRDMLPFRSNKLTDDTIAGLTDIGTALVRSYGVMEVADFGPLPDDYWANEEDMLAE